jgi:ribosomal-protein-alanine N-acetyltransferase
MKQRVRIAHLLLSDESDFLAAVQRSQKLHAPWVTPPATRSAFRAKVERMEPANFSFSIRLAQSGELVGYAEITNIVRGVFLCAYLGYYALDTSDKV